MSAHFEDSIAEWVFSLNWNAIPHAAKEVARSCVLDGIATGLAGSRCDSYLQSARAIRDLSGTPQGRCSVLGAREKAMPAQAAWLNGIAIHALDFDDTSYAGIVHVTAAVLPAALAVTEHTGGSFSNLLRAYLAGAEVELALGLALGDSLYAKGHWATTSLGVLGSATAAAKALKLPIEQTAQAIRIAFNTSIGTRSVHGSSAKPYLCGAAAKLGVEAAWAARYGLRAGASTLAGRYGYAAVANDGRLAPEMLGILGAQYRVLEPGIAFKLYPVCSASQAGIEATLDLRNKFTFNASDVVSVQVYGTPLVVSCLVYMSPQTVAQAQFSMQFAVATALLCGDVGIEHLSTTWIHSGILRTFLGCIELIEDTDMVMISDTIRYPEATRVEIHLADGRSLSHTVLAAQGMPEVPLQVEQLAEKFIKCAECVYPKDGARTLYKRLNEVSDEVCVEELLKCFRAPGGANEYL